MSDKLLLVIIYHTCTYVTNVVKKIIICGRQK